LPETLDLDLQFANNRDPPLQKANQLQAGERPVAEMQFGIGELSGRVALVVRRDLDGHCGVIMVS